MSYSGGRYVITKIKGNLVTLECWENRKRQEHLTVPEPKPAGWPEVVVGLQLLQVVHKKKVSWLPAKRQLKDPFIPGGSSLTSAITP